MALPLPRVRRGQYYRDEPPLALEDGPNRRQSIPDPILQEKDIEVALPPAFPPTRLSMDAPVTDVSSDRLLKYFFDQISALERKMESQRQYFEQRLERESEFRSRVESSLRVTSETSGHSFNEFQGRLAMLEEAVRREERAFVDLREKVKVTYLETSHLKLEVQNLQAQEEKEMGALRNLMHDRRNDDERDLMRDRSRIVMLGSDVSKLEDHVQMMDARVQEQLFGLEDRLKRCESKNNDRMRADIQVSADSAGGFKSSSEAVLKLDARVGELESSLIAFRAEINRERELRTRSDTLREKAVAELKAILTGMEADWEKKSDMRAQELLKKILAEQEERIRQQDDIRYQMEMRDKVRTEKALMEKEEIYERLGSLDMLIKTEGKRREESLVDMRGFLDLQTRNILNSAKAEDQKRSQVLAAFRQQISDQLDNMKQEIFRHGNVCERERKSVSEVLASEIKSRVQELREMREYINQTARSLLMDIETVKSLHSKQADKLGEELRKQGHVCGDRSDKLSRYLDEQLRKVVETTARLISQLDSQDQELTEKLREQQESGHRWQSNMEERVDRQGQDITTLRADTAESFKIVEERLWAGVKEWCQAQVATAREIEQEIFRTLHKSNHKFEGRLEELRKHLTSFKKSMTHICTSLRHDLTLHRQHTDQDTEEISAQIDHLDHRFGRLLGLLEMVRKEAGHKLEGAEASMVACFEADQCLLRAQIRSLSDCTSSSLQDLNQSLHRAESQIRVTEQWREDHEAQHAEQDRDVEYRLQEHNHEIKLLEGNLATTTAKIDQESASLKQHIEDACAGVSEKISLDLDKIQTSVQATDSKAEGCVSSLQKVSEKFESMEAGQVRTQKQVIDVVLQQLDERLSFIRLDLKKENEVYWKQTLSAVE